MARQPADDRTHPPELALGEPESLAYKHAREVEQDRRARGVARPTPTADGQVVAPGLPLGRQPFTVPRALANHAARHVVELRAGADGGRRDPHPPLAGTLVWRGEIPAIVTSRSAWQWLSGARFVEVVLAPGQTIALETPLVEAVVVGGASERTSDIALLVLPRLLASVASRHGRLVHDPIADSSPVLDAERIWFLSSVGPTQVLRVRPGPRITTESPRRLDQLDVVPVLVPPRPLPSGAPLWSADLDEAGDWRGLLTLEGVAIDCSTSGTLRCHGRTSIDTLLLEAGTAPPR